LTLVVVVGFLLCSGASAGEGTAETQVIKQEIEALRAEMSVIRKELQALRADMKTVLSELKVIKSAKAVARPTRQPDTKVYDVTIGKAPILGAKEAPVTIVEFYDVQCPYCIREYPKLKEILKAYPGKVRLVLKHFPLSFHKKALPAHAALEFVYQEKGLDTFWKMHDMIVANPRKLEVTDLRGYAEKLGLNLTKFDAVMADKNKINELVKSDMAEASKYGVRGTPTVLINGLKLANRSIDGYKARIDQILKGADKKEKK
jgi:protein-disulfide isomerase